MILGGGYLDFNIATGVPPELFKTTLFIYTGFLLLVVGRTGAVVSVADKDQGVPGSRPGSGTVCCGLEQGTFTHCLVLVKPRKPWTDD